MTNNIFHIKPWTPKVRTTAQRLIYHIHEVAPELEVLFMGAAALGLPGKNDIDIDILCRKESIKAYSEKLIPVLGEPQEMKDNLSVWRFNLDGFEVDAILSDPRLSHVPLQRKRFEILRESPELLVAYKKLKESCDGLPDEEYEEQKIAFLENMVFPSKS